jgi:hypothetical protein
MGESSTPESSKSYLELGVIALLTIAANHLLPADIRREATDAICITGGGFVWAVRWLRRHIAYRQLVALETKWLNEAIAERNKPDLSLQKQEELDADIAQRRRGLQELQRENLKVQSKS